MTFDFTALRSPVPSGFRVVQVDAGTFHVVHKASRRNYWIEHKEGEFYLYAGSSFADPRSPQREFVVKTDSLRGLLLGLGWIKN